MDNMKRYDSLAQWQAALPSDSVSLGNMTAGQFDPNSVASNDKAECFVDWENRDLRMPEKLPAGRHDARRHQPWTVSVR